MLPVGIGPGTIFGRLTVPLEPTFAGADRDPDTIRQITKVISRACGVRMTTYLPATTELPADSPEALARPLRGPRAGRRPADVPPTAERVDAMLDHAAGDPDEVLAHPAPPRRDRDPARRRHQRGAGGVHPGDVPGGAHRHPGARRAGDQPARRQRDHAPGRTARARARARSRASAGFHAGVGAFGPGNRANATVGRAVRLVLLHVAGARPGLGRRRDPWAAGEVHVLRGGEPRRLAVGGLRGESRRRRTQRRHRALRRGPAQRARHGKGRRPAADPRQDRVGDDVARHEQRADQPGRVLRDPRARARVQPGVAAASRATTCRCTCTTAPACPQPCSAGTSKSWPGRSG